MSYPIEQKIKARRLFITGGQSQEDVSKKTNVHERVLSNWSTKEGWVEKRSKYLRATEEMEINKIVLKNVMLKKAIETQSTEDIQRVILFEIMTSVETDPKRQLVDYLRQIKNLTYQEIGNICGVSRQAISEQHKVSHTTDATAKIRYELARRNEKICEFAKRIKQPYHSVGNVIRGACSKSNLRHVIAEGLDIKCSDIWPDAGNGDRGK